ncbi:hypothetical protein LOZ80_12245 [Paenibacillus sp. HWE-109]|uniref:hypothetical protein n=1 Tax=Paenibacillus sp. HWE-109 TaxID=1306526 RepID=UPI001EDFA6CB|nr:hypothetical protein [Paenibacillus sp. HWE-109]UKS29651.1 hypothetical protein LOZ80_12245 [Paenibacillus sp. HWE-109]
MAIYQVNYKVNNISKLGYIEVPEKPSNQIELLRIIKESLSHLENVAIVDIRVKRYVEM